MITKHGFEFPGPSPLGQPGAWGMTSLVMDKEDFNELITLIENAYDGKNIATSEALDSSAIQRLRDAGRLPLVARGTKTEFLFQKYGVSTEFFSAIIRGAAKRMGLRLPSDDLN